MRKMLSMKSTPSIIRKLEPFWYLLPFLLGLAVFTVYPFIHVLLISFWQDYGYLSDAGKGIGMANYRVVLNDRNFLLALKNTGFYVLFVVPTATGLSIILAVLLNRDIRLKGLFQTTFFLPMVTSVTAVGLVWKWLYNYEYGLFNFLLSRFGIAPINWLNDPKYGLAAVVIYGIWNLMPVTIILLLSGLQSVNPQYQVAAKVDGAGDLLIFFRIMLPLLAPTIGLVLIVNVISTSKVFMELFPLFNGKPGPAYSLYTIVFYIYDMFYLKWKLGPAAAAAMLLFFVVFSFTMLQLYIQRKWKYE